MLLVIKELNEKQHTKGGYFMLEMAALFSYVESKQLYGQYGQVGADGVWRNKVNIEVVSSNRDRRYKKK